MDLNREQKEALEKQIENASKNDVKNIISQYKDYEIKGGVLERVFEKIYVNQMGFSPSVSIISELEQIHRSFHTTNGGDWCRSKQSYLGKKYIILRNHNKGSISTVKENHGGINIHPILSRPMTPRELATLQSFPEDFIFERNKKWQLVQIGNAVPCYLGKAIGLTLRKMMDEHNK